MKRLLIATGGIVLGMALVTLFGGARPDAARADCEDPAEEFTEFWYISQPAGSQGLVAQGQAPLTVTIRMVGGVAIFGTDSLQMRLDWGDGSASVPVAVQNCPDGLSSFWPGQDLTHTYTVAGPYVPQWLITSEVGNFQGAMAFITVTAAQQPTATSPAPTSTSPSGGSTVPPGPTTGPGTPQVGPTSGSGTAAPAETAETAETTGTVRATATARGTRTPTPTEAPGESTSEAPLPPGAGELVDDPPPAHPDTPELLQRMREPSDVPWDAGAVGTSLAIAGATIWVLFSSVLLNQILQDNRAEVDRRTAWLSQPARRLARIRPAIAIAGPAWWRTAAEAVGVLALIGIIYSLAEPALGWNASSAALFVSVVVGVGLISYLTCGVEIFANRRVAGARSTVKPYVATLVIAVISVVLTRLFELRPGVVYGFVASTVVFGAVAPTREQTGRIALATVVTGLAVAVAAWTLLGPIRNIDSDAWLASVGEATAVIIFVGGIEGVAFSMIPLASTDGGKLYRWNRWLWIGVSAIAAFLTWHVLLGTERGYFSGLRQASSLAVLGVFLFYVVLTAALLWYFQFRKRPPAEAPVQAPPEE